MDDTDEYFFFLFIRKTPMFVSSHQWLTILNKRLYEGAIDCASLSKLYYCMSLICDLSRENVPYGLPFWNG